MEKDDHMYELDRLVRMRLGLGPDNVLPWSCLVNMKSFHKKLQMCCGSANYEKYCDVGRMLWKFLIQDLMNSEFYEFRILWIQNFTNSGLYEFRILRIQDFINSEIFTFTRMCYGPRRSVLKYFNVNLKLQNKRRIRWGIVKCIYICNHLNMINVVAIIYMQCKYFFNVM